jgi:hypothetical protein
MIDPERNALYEAIARRFGMTAEEIGKFVKAIVCFELDPIIAEGEPFMFNDPRTTAFDDANFYALNDRVPKPDDDVDLMESLKQWQKDSVAMRRLCEHHGDELTFETVARIFLQNAAWVEFWAVRHPLGETRERYSALARAAEPDTAEMLEMQARMARRSA